MDLGFMNVHDWIEPNQPADYTGDARYKFEGDRKWVMPGN